MTEIMKHTRLAVAAAVASGWCCGALGAPVTGMAPQKIDATVTRAMKAFEVPGIAVAIVKDGKVVFAKGYGVRELGKPQAVDADTLFQIGSNTKAFTAAALAILVDEGKIHWDDKVIQYMPEFQMYDPYVTREFTIRDLLTHRSGLGLGAGDLMFFPESDFSREEVIHSLRYLKPVSSFRSKFDYDNLLYMVAGQVVAKVTSQSWESFVKQRILDPLQMQPCAPSYELIEDRSDVATPHAVIEGKLTAIRVESLNAVGPAGSINCSVSRMSQWLITQLNAGTGPQGQKIFSAERSADMWSINTIRPLNPALAELNHSNFAGYGLGWGIQDQFGHKRVSHTGGVAGTVTWVSMIPDLKLGVLVFTNQQNGFAMEAIGNQILDSYLGAPSRDWVTLAGQIAKQRSDEAEKIEAESAKTAATAIAPPLPLASYAGKYADPWRGEAAVDLHEGSLVLKFSRTRELEGPLTPYSANVFIVKWLERGLHADAYVRFSQGFDGKVDGFTMQAVSPATDFSFDFQDLNFRKHD
jgi:CubicO group peptidase (beta-lactamase class C family)